MLVYDVLADDGHSDDTYGDHAVDAKQIPPAAFKPLAEPLQRDQTSQKGKDCSKEAKE